MHVTVLYPIDSSELFQLLLYSPDHRMRSTVLYLIDSSELFQLLLYSPDHRMRSTVLYLIDSSELFQLLLYSPDHRMRSTVLYLIDSSELFQLLLYSPDHRMRSTVLYLIDSSELFQLLLYSPDHRLQPWRYVSYMLLHLDTTHLLINLGIQTVLAIPLEAEQGFLRTALVYILGGLAGSLGTAVLDPELSMVGSSAGVYALLLAQLPNILYNYELLRYQWYRVVSVVCLCVGDLTYDMFRQAGPVISWAAHVSGAVAGLLVGLTVFTSYSDCSPLSLSLLRYASIVLFTILVDNTTFIVELG
ncbi:Rhomboid- protein 3 [Homalodisca vitripennis]|nr:Rhomboid- protein 3 [Homalodisca vitripennis]